MKKIDVQDLIQLLGMVGIIGSLIFVGLEMRQSQRIALAAQQTERTNMFLNNVNSLAEPKLNYSTMQEQLAGQTPVTMEYEWAMINSAHAFWWIAENDYTQYSLGLMGEEIWQAKLHVMSLQYNGCAVREVWEARRNTLDARLVELVERFPDECTE